MSAALSPAVQVLLLFSAIFPAAAQTRPWPRGMFCGGNELRSEGVLEASKVSGLVLFCDGSAVMPHARIQVQIKGRTDILHDFEANDKGRFKLPKLRPGEYWLGISTPGFNLHYWDLRITRKGGTKKIRVQLSLGT